MTDWRKGHFKTHIAILGAGFAGVFAARSLGKLYRKNPDVHITLVNPRNYFVFQPLLPEVAAGTLEATTTVSPLRQLLPDVDFDCAEVESIDLDNQQVHFQQVEGSTHTPMPFDHLVLSMGMEANLGIIPGMTDHGLPMKDLNDAFRLRHHIIRKLEEAANEPDRDIRREMLTIVVVGGGFSGVETAAELHEAMVKAIGHYPEISKDEPKVYLVQAIDRILPELSPELSQKALEILSKRQGLEILLNDVVTSVTPTRVSLKHHPKIRTRTVVCTVGNRPNSIVRDLNLPMERGRVLTEESMQVKGYDNLWSLGDMAVVPNAADGKSSPPTAQFAMRQGKVVADNIKAVIDGKSPQAFSHTSQGMLASLGLHNAVAELNLLGLPIRISGFIAWWFWRTVYLMKLPSWLRRLRVALDWTLDIFFPRGLVNLDVSPGKRIARCHYEAGQEICIQNEIANHFYIVHQGKAELIQRDASGATTVVGRLGPGDVFGDDALSPGGRRQYTVRAMTEVEVYALKNRDANILVEALDSVKGSVKRAQENRTKAELAWLNREKDSPIMQIPIAQIMSANPETVSEDLSIGALFDRYMHTRYTGFPVVNQQDHLVGIMTRSNLYQAINSDLPEDTPISQLMQRKLITVYGHEPVGDGLCILQEKGIKRLLVVDQNDEQKIVGILSATDIFRAQRAEKVAIQPPIAKNA